MLQNENIHISELLAVAREAQGSNYVKGEGTGLGKKGENYRFFLTKEAYKKSLIWEKQQKISIQKYARVDGHTLSYLPIQWEIRPENNRSEKACG